MNDGNFKDGRPSAVATTEKNSMHDRESFRPLPADAGDRVSSLVAVEEIFLEGDSAVMLQHEAGSARAKGLLKFADILDSGSSRKR